MNKITTAQKTLEYYVVLSGESTPPVPTPTQVTIDGNFEIEQSGSTYTMSFGIQNFDWSSLESGWTGIVVYGQNTLTFDSSNLNNNTINISVGESQIDLTATTATMEITSGTDEYEGTSNVEVVFVDYMFIENTYPGQNTVTLNSNKSGNPSSTYYSSSVEYSKDRINWTTITFDTSTPYNITMNSGEKVYFRNDSSKWNYFANNYSSFTTSFKTSQNCGAGGDLRSLLKYSDIENVGLTQGCYASLFAGSSGLTTVPSNFLPFTTLAPYCYKGMFEQCNSLTTSPALPATTLEKGCYQSMFRVCTSLTNTPTLPATTISDFCYYEMFYECSSLTTIPSLPATTLGSYCYYGMFGKTSITSIPNNYLQATTLVSYCYSYMFKECSSLVTVPSNLLPATTLENGCYSGMFYRCSSITKAPELPATTLVSYCYMYMFENCTSLNEVTTYADDISANNCTISWLSGVANSGTFHNHGSATYTSGADGIPAGWTVVTQ